ncbi:MAG: endolytic transglycosylase MltG [bacterium]|nr:endolytic transglycosylase MltG [bacterium]
MYRVLNLFLLITLIVIFLFSFLMYPPLPYRGIETVTIKPGMNARDIAILLRKRGLISSVNVFLFTLRLNGNNGKNFIPGTFDIPRGLRVDQLLKYIFEARPKTVWVTIPEGFNSREIAERLSSIGVVSKEEFFNALNRPIKGNYPSFIKPPYEGFLFPDTYEFFLNSPPEIVIKRFLDRFVEVLPANFEEKSRKLGLEPREAITLASLIEKEAKIDSERPIIAQVLLKRLKIGMKLQCDATVQYVFDKPKPVLSYEDLKIDSPYNTYLHYGLPPGPICNPGLSSIVSAINPANTDYLFYFTKGNGIHIFSRTYEEHLEKQK